MFSDYYPPGRIRVPLKNKTCLFFGSSNYFSTKLKIPSGETLRATFAILVYLFIFLRYIFTKFYSFSWDERSLLSCISSLSSGRLVRVLLLPLIFSINKFIYLTIYLYLFAIKIDILAKEFMFYLLKNLENLQEL